MKVLVTGGCGFVGSNYISYILKKHPKDQVVCVDIADINLLLEEHKKSFKYIKANITNKKEIYEIFEKEKPDYVVNCVDVNKRSFEFSSYAKTNIIGTTVLLDACNKYSVKKYHQISSAEVYGELPLGREMYYTEKSPLHPINQYAASKASSDLLALSYYETFRVPVVISRSVNVYGPYQKIDKQIPSQIIKAARGETLDIYGTGADVRDWIHIDDYVKAIDLVTRKGDAGEIYNIGSHNEIRSIYLVRIILNESDKSEDLIVYHENRRGKERRNALDYSKIEKELGWSPKIDFADGMRKTIAWYTKNSGKLK